MRRYTSFACLMALVIGWSSVAFAVQKPIHLLMMNTAPNAENSVRLQTDQGQPHAAAIKAADAAKAEVQSESNVQASAPHHAMHTADGPGAGQPESVNPAASHAASTQPIPDCHASMPHAQSSSAPFAAAQASMHCQTDMQQMSSKAQCADCALWHCQIASLSLDMHPVQLNAPELYVLADQPNTLLSAEHLPGYWQELLRPPKA